MLYLINKHGLYFGTHAIFLNKGLCLNPVMSFYNNFGFDGSGENCSKISQISSNKLNESLYLNYPSKIKEDSYYLSTINNHFNYPNIFLRILRRITKSYLNFRKNYFLINIFPFKIILIKINFN